MAEEMPKSPKLMFDQTLQNVDHALFHRQNSTSHSRKQLSDINALPQAVVSANKGRGGHRITVNNHHGHHEPGAGHTNGHGQAHNLRPPDHHTQLEHEHEHEHQHQWFGEFVDLVFVAVIINFADQLKYMTLGECVPLDNGLDLECMMVLVLEAALFFLAFFMVWYELSVTLIRFTAI